MRAYDLIGFGDEVPGILALVAAAREYRRRSGRFPRSLLITQGDSQLGIGGHIVRGRLAYLDRSSVAPEIRKALKLPTFGTPSALYQEWLDRSGVQQVAIDPDRANAVLRQMLAEAQVSLLGRVELESVEKQDGAIAAIRLTKGEVYPGRIFIDSTVNAALAVAAGMTRQPGFASLGLPEAELPVTLVVETVGLSVSRLRQLERQLLDRLLDEDDAEAQRWIAVAAGNDPALRQFLLRSLRDPNGNLRPMWVGQDYIDVRSKALSIAFHAFRGKSMSLWQSGFLFDNGNIAQLEGRLSWNALLFQVSAAEAQALAQGVPRPTFPMLEEFGWLEKWLKQQGAIQVRSAPELYIRHAGNVAEVVQPLSGGAMLAGGVPQSEAIASFGYAFDIRGGINGLSQRAKAKQLQQIQFPLPLMNVGIQHALSRSIPNLAIVSPASGFVGYASAAGRIVEFNVAVGQGVGIAASLALTGDRPLHQIADREVRSVLAETGQLPKIYGKLHPDADRLHQFERVMPILKEL